MKHLIVLLAAAMCVTALSAQQSDTLVGQIVDIRNIGIGKVKVNLLTSERQTKTDREGFFMFTDAMLSDTLVVTVKKNSFTLPIDNRRRLRIKALDNYTSAESTELPIDIGYGTIRQRDKTTSSNTISGEEIRRRGFTNIYDVLRAHGLRLNVSPSGEVDMTAMRGINSLHADQTPLFLVDGVTVQDIGYINVNEIESIEIVKDANIYGAQGANGAILITMIKHNAKK